MRDSFLRGCVALGIAVALVTELLSPFHLLRRGPLIVVWLALLILAAFRWRPPRKIAIRPVEATIALVCCAIVAVVAVTAWLSPPNSADAMAYHLPRVVYWAQYASVAFFPTPYFNQISLQPLMEYFFLHSYLLSGGDRFINLITCAAFLASIVGVSALAGALGLGTRGQAFAALFCATLPNGILQASGAKNEWMVALWLICAAYFAAREDAPFTGFSLGLALATKATAYLFAPPLILAVLLIKKSEGTAPLRSRLGITASLGITAWIAAGILMINTPQYVRNWQLSGSPLGFDSAQGDGLFRWQNDHPGVKSTVSNFIRHSSDQLGDRNAHWNQAVFRSALALHRTLGIDPDDPADTWPYARFTAPINSNHEADSNNRWHLLLLAIAMLFAAIARKRTPLLYGAGVFAGYLLFCFYLKWQPFTSRLELPLFVLAAPVAGAFLEALRPALLALPVCLFLLTTARLPLFQNWTRPLTGPQSIFVTARDDNYFRDMTQWDYGATYLHAVDLTARSGCHDVGIDINRDQIEYPYQAILRERDPAVRFWHTGVRNASARYAPKGQPHLCAVFCPDCGWLPSEADLYREFGPPIEFAHFQLFLPAAR
jgi:hypothetical protein